jgi:hypothetical protein
MKPPQDPPNTLVQATESSLDDKVGKWEARYSGMAMPALLDTQRYLLEMQDDLMIRLLAVNKVFASKHGG